MYHHHGVARKSPHNFQEVLLNKLNLIFVTVFGQVVLVAEGGGPVEKSEDETGPTAQQVAGHLIKVKSWRGIEESIRGVVKVNQGNKGDTGGRSGMASKASTAPTLHEVERARVVEKRRGTGTF